MFWLVCGKIGLFPVLFYRKKVVCQFAASSFNFTSPFIKNNRKTCLGLLATKLEVSNFISEKQRFGFSPESTLLQASYHQKYVLVSWHQNWVL